MEKNEHLSAIRSAERRERVANGLRFTSVPQNHFREVRTAAVVPVGSRATYAPESRRQKELLVAPILERLGYKLERAKTNMGLGRITNPVQKKEDQLQEIPSETR